MSESEHYYSYWGKAGEDERFHLLPYHSLDVAACGSVLLESHDPLRACLSDRVGLDAAQLVAWLSFFLALHDLGKFSHGFQGLRPDLFERLQPGRTHGNYSVRHDTLGWVLWDDALGAEFVERIAGKSLPHRQRRQALRAIDIWMRTVAGHHGQPPRNDQTRAASYFSSDDRRAAGAFVDACHALLLGADIALPEAKAWESALKPLSWWLAGIAVLCDWLGSNAEGFPFRSVRMPLEDYWHKHALPSARKAIQASGLVPLRIPALKLVKLFDYLNPATPLQALAETLPLTDSPQLFILEDVTGAGKTEAALMLAQRLMAKGLGDGIFIALPTMATSNAMFRRVAEKRLDKCLFSGEPGLVLAHSAARLVEHPNRRAEPLPTGPAEMDYAKDEASAANLRTGWIGDSRKKALLADFGIGTLDQALLGILPVRHQSLRLLGLMRKVLIVDEVHACDDYMLVLLEDLLRFQASVGASVLLLSATLPKATRQSLADAFRKGLGQPAASLEDESYPLLTQVTGSETLECPLTTRPEVVRSVRVERIGERHAVLERLLAIHRAGQCACWVRNSVSDAIDAWRELADAGVAEDRLHLFHARFALGDRLGIEADVLERFGPDSGHDDRRGHILVATQVVEQSLDLDFDWMASDLAPIDLLIQRAGRLRRHCRGPDGQRAAREERGEPVLCVFAPEPRDDASRDWLKPLLPATAAVYPDLGQLWRTARLPERLGRIAMPSGARDLIEGVYGPEPEATPPGLALVGNQFEGKRQANRSIGRFNALDLADGYRSQTDYWDDIHTPTRLGDARVRVRLARWQDGRLIPWFDDPRHPWPMSEVNVRENWLAQEAEPSDPALREAMEDYRETVLDQGRWSKLLILEPAEGSGWEGEAIDGAGRRKRFRYEVETGLSKIE